MVEYYLQILRKYLGEEREGNITMLMKQQSMLPLSLEQARAQVQRLKNQSQHT